MGSAAVKARTGARGRRVLLFVFAAMWLASCAAPSRPAASSVTTSSLTAATPPIPTPTTEGSGATTRRVAPSTRAPTLTTTAGNGIPKPDPRLTPGVTYPVTAAQVCISGYASSVRSVSDAEKNAVYAEYGITSHAPYSYEVDHLISLELGGSNDIRNLWPEPYAGPGGAHAKDAIENELHALVCSGTISLPTAQAEIVHWWTLPGATSAPGPGPTVPTPASSPSTSAATTGSGYVYPGAFCSTLGAIGYTSEGTRMICSDHSAAGVPYEGGSRHWHAA